MDEMVLRQRICDVARQLWQRGLMVADEGLISVEVHRRRFLVTPPGVRRAELSPRSLLVTDLSGDAMAAQEILPAKDWLTHRVAYQTRDGAAARSGEQSTVRATILARPPMLCALARRSSGGGVIDLSEMQLPIASAGDESAIGMHFASADAIALPGCGVVTVGATLDDALNLLERLELAAMIELAVWQDK